MKRLPLLIVFAALLVSAPRLAVAFVLADGVTLAPTLAAWVFTGTGVASGVVLTLGNAYLARVLAAHWKRRGGLWALLLVSWVLFLAFAVVLIAPLLASGLRHSVLAEVLPSAAQQWGWAVIAALSVEVLAAAAMGALVLSDEPTAVGASKRNGGIRDALRERIVRTLNADAMPQAPQSTTVATAMPELSAAVPTVQLAEPTREGWSCPQCGKWLKNKSAESAHPASTPQSMGNSLRKPRQRMETTAAVANVATAMPRRWQVRAMRQAISPRLAIKIFLNTSVRSSAVGAFR